MKKLLSMVLTATLVSTMAFSAAAAPVIITSQTAGSGSSTSGVRTTTGTGILKSGIRGINEDQYKDSLANIPFQLNTNSTLSLDDMEDLEVAPGDIIKIPMKGVLFTDADGAPFANYTGVSLSALNSAKITVKMTNTVGAGAVKASLKGNSSGSYIEVEFAKTPAIDGQKFSCAIYLAKSGSRKSETRIALKGIIESEQKEVDTNDDYVDISDGSSVKATKTVKNIEIYLGENCTITRTLTRGNEYSGIALTDILTSDEHLFGKYPDLEQIYRLETIKLKTTGNIVTFDLGDDYYVYNSNGTYIGTTAHPLPYWTKYYMTTKKYSQLSVTPKA